jgi:hypothetical protein
MAATRQAFTEEKKKCSFLKKRTKKLLRSGAEPLRRPI